MSVQPKNLDCQEASSSKIPILYGLQLYNNYELALAKCCSVTVIYLLLLFSRSLQMIIINFIIFFPLNPSEVTSFCLLCQYKKKILEHLLIRI